MAGGFQALSRNTTGSFNIALGDAAGSNLTTGSNNIDIDAPGVAGEANAIRIGKSGTQKKTFVAAIHGVAVASGVGVIVGNAGQLGTVVSSARFKEAIKPMDRASEAILALRPVTFRYKEELDPDKIPQFGLIAEEVEKVNPDLVVRDEDGKVTTVRYEAINAMLLNEFLKQHRKAQVEKRKVAELEATVEQQQKQIVALTGGLQKVSEQLDLIKPGPQVIAKTQ
jgi:Chaperone of endosialidase